MSFLNILLIGIGLAMDAFAVSVTSGVTIRKMHLRHALLIASFFGVFQAVMPIIGWSLGGLAAGFIGDYDHWIAFGLLALIGGKMIFEAFFGSDDGEPKDPLNIYVLFVLAIATSIDALAVGITFSFLNVSIYGPVIVIGLVTFVMSVIGAYLGNRLGHAFNEKYLEALGGLILVGIGVKIVLEHTVLA